MSPTRADAPKQRPSSSGSERPVSSHEGYTLYAYAAVQVWAQAAEKAGSLELPAMIAALRQHQFDTVLGPIDFDDKGDLAVQNPGLVRLAGRRHLRAAGMTAPDRESAVLPRRETGETPFFVSPGAAARAPA